MTATFDHMELHELVDLLTDEERRELRPVVLRLVANHAHTAERTATAEPTGRHLSFAGTIHADPDFASSSREVLWRELGGHE